MYTCTVSLYLRKAVSVSLQPSKIKVLKNFSLHSILEMPNLYYDVYLEFLVSIVTCI